MELSGTSLPPLASTRTIRDTVFAAHGAITTETGGLIFMWSMISDGRIFTVIRAMGLLPMSLRRPELRTLAQAWASAGWITTTTALRIFMWLTCGPPPGNAFPRRKFSKRIRQKKFVLSIASTQWGIRCCGIAPTEMAKEFFKIERNPLELEWGAGHGRAMHLTSIMTVSRTSI